MAKAVDDLGERPVALNMLAANAYQQNAVASCYEGDDGQISQIYVW